MSNNHLHPIFQAALDSFNPPKGSLLHIENHMTQGNAEHDAELTPQQEAALLESATDDVDLGDYWGDQCRAPVSEQLRAMCEAIRMGQDDATIARMARHLRTLAIDEVFNHE